MARSGLNDKGQRGEPAGATTAAELSLRSAFDYAPIGMAVLTPDGVVITCNAALGELLRRAPESLAGTTLFEITHPDDLPQAQRNCALIRSGTRRILRHECRLVRDDATPVWVLASTAAVPEAPGRPAHLIMHIEDIDERKTLEAELVYRAQHDPLTGLANRNLLKQRLDDALREDSCRSCLLFVDLDGFKAVNDRHGHIAGDLVLQQLAQRLTALLRPQDVCARLGGDEFVVLCVDTEPRQADAIADRLRAAVAEPFTVDGHTIEITAAVGVGATGVARTARVDANGLIRQADERMYEAKRRRP
jgi:diguanylate cyclase (GGDEF)-like protein/PAS domain S-box-containing protein